MLIKDMTKEEQTLVDKWHQEWKCDLSLRTYFANV